MEEEKKLYPLKFCPLQDNYAWGSAVWRLADLGWRDSFVLEGWLASNTVSEVMDTYMERVTGDPVFEYWGRQFPVCLKHIKVSGRMPLQVHPDDSLSAERYDFLGKEKIWYVLRAGRDAALLLGWKRDTDASEVMQACADGSEEDLMNCVAPHAGQFFRIEPGTVHAAQGDLEILEIAESSPLDFCVSPRSQELSEDEFDPALDLTEALDFIDYKAFKPAPDTSGKPSGGVERLVSIPQMEVCRIDLSGAMNIHMEKFGAFILYHCLQGSASVQMQVLGQTASFPLKEGETMLVPAECPDYILVPASPATRLLEITVPPREDHDPYINPAASPEPEDGEI